VSFQLSELAQKFDLELKGQAEAEINSVASLKDAALAASVSAPVVATWPSLRKPALLQLF